MYHSQAQEETANGERNKTEKFQSAVRSVPVGSSGQHFRMGSVRALNERTSWLQVVISGCFRVQAHIF